MPLGRYLGADATSRRRLRGLADPVRVDQLVDLVLFVREFFLSEKKKSCCYKNWTVD